MGADTKRGQLAVLRHGINLIYLWCNRRNLETAPQIDEPLKKLSEELCGGIDIFAQGFQLPPTSLKSIFSDLHLSPDSLPETRYINPNPLKEDSIPFYNSPPEENWEARAIKEIKRIYETIEENPTALLILLEKYGSSIPISTSENYNSISLYEHVRFLSCVASSNGNSEKPFLFVSADFSGIQDFIYTISSKGALKSLRARSFFLQVLTNHIIYEILEATSTTPANIVYSGGGGFSLVLENSRQNKESLKKVKESINRYLLDELGGKLYLGMQWIEVSEREMCAPQFKSTWLKVGRLLEKDKLRRFIEFMPEPLKKIKPIRKTNAEECQICHRDDLKEMGSIGRGSDKIRACLLCESLYRWGDDLTDYRYVVIRQSYPSHHFIELPSLNGIVYYRIIPKPETPKDYQARWVKNSWNIDEYSDGKTFPLLCADHVIKASDLRKLEPGEADSTADFDSLAQASAGKKLLSALRMDADNLGFLFTRGFGEDKFDLPHYSSLSRQLSLFFSIYLNLLCEGKNQDALDIMGRLPAQGRGRNVTVIYAGGDDLFIVGAWNEVVELACDIAKSFYHYGGENPDVSISGGVVLTKEDFPLYQIANLSKKAEDNAKDYLSDCEGTECSPSYHNCPLHQGNGKYGKCARKNAGSLFYVPSRVVRSKERREVVTAAKWDEIEKRVIHFVELLRTLSKRDVTDRLELEGLSHDFIRRLFEMVDLWEREEVLYRPMMHYVVSRLKKGLSDKLKDQSSEEALALKKLLYDKGEPINLLNPDLIKVLWVPLTWVDFLIRKEEGKGG